MEADRFWQIVDACHLAAGSDVNARVGVLRGEIFPRQNCNRSKIITMTRSGAPTAGIFGALPT
jgi:hypothetical protein